MLLLPLACAVILAIGDDAQPPSGKDVLAAAAHAPPPKAVRYTVEQRGVGEAARSAPVVIGTIIQQRADVPDAGPVAGRYRAFGEITRADGAKTPFDWSYDGATLRVLDPREKVVIVLDNPTATDAGRLLGFETGLLPMPLLDANRWIGVGDKAKSLESKPPREVGGATCDVVEVTTTFSAPDGREITGTTVWAFDRERHLPRLYESSSSSRVITALELDPALDAGAFVTPVPEGYAQKRATAGGADQRELLHIGDAAPAWTLKGPDGKDVSLADLKGKVVALDFWATWCGPCKRAMPAIQALRKRFPEDKVAIFGVSVSEEPGADPAGYMRKQEFTYGLLLNGETIAPTYKAKMLPTIYIIDPAGRIIHAERGYRDNAEAELAKVIEKALAN